MHSILTVFTSQINIVTVIQLHREFLRAGSDVLQSFTFLQMTDELLESYGIDVPGAEINDAGVRLVKEVAAEGDAITGGGIARTGALYRDVPKRRALGCVITHLGFL